MTIECTLYLTNSTGSDLTLSRSRGTVYWSPAPPTTFGNGMTYGPINVRGGQNAMQFILSYIDKNSVDSNPQYEILVKTSNIAEVVFRAPPGHTIAWQRGGGLPDFTLNVTYQ